MDEKEAEALPVMGTIFLVSLIIMYYNMCVCRMSNHVESRESNMRMLKVRAVKSDQ